MAKPDGQRNLAMIRESGSTSRVLNLALVFERFGDCEDYAAKPMFKSVMLNRALILKHVVRPEERDLFNLPPINTTKIVLPFSAKELRLGGRTLLFGEKTFERALRDLSGAIDNYAFDSDLELLRLMNALPSFDPFLMRERMRQSGYEAARCYLDMSQADITRMRTFVGREIEQLVGLAYANGGAAARDLSSKLADKLMTDETAKSLDPLRLTLRLSDEDYREGVFAWKGFLYYKWSTAEFLPRLPDISREMLSARITGADAEARKLLADMRKRIVDYLSVGTQRVQQELLDYGTAFAALAAGRPGEFRDFLLNAPSRFIPIGEATGIIRHVESFWRFRFPPGRPLLIPVDDAFELYADFDATLGGMVMIREGGAPGMASAV